MPAGSRGKRAARHLGLKISHKESIIYSVEGAIAVDIRSRIKRKGFGTNATAIYSQK
jgi:hypothetical protein